MVAGDCTITYDYENTIIGDNVQTVGHENYVHGDNNAYTGDDISIIGGRHLVYGQETPFCHHLQDVMLILTVWFLLHLLLLLVRITVVIILALLPLADVTRTFALILVILHVWPLPHAIHAVPCRFRSQPVFNLTNAIAMSALDCHFTLLSYIVVIIIDSSMGIVIIVVGLGVYG